MSLAITKRDGIKEPFNADRINRSIERACKGLSDPIGMVTQIASETRLTLYDGITEEELDAATINAALQNAQFDVEFDKVATRIFLKTMYKRVLGDYDSDTADLKELHRSQFKKHILEVVEAKLVDERLGTLFDLDELAATLEPANDELYRYSGCSTMSVLCLLKGPYL